VAKVWKAIGIGASATSAGLASAYSSGETITVFEGAMTALAVLIAVAAYLSDPNSDISETDGKHEK
jgi:hypothetical protein